MKNYPHEYYHDLITQKSWEELINLKKLADFVLIGGWATYLYTRALKSKDIDIAINYDQLPILSKSYRLNKNERLHKYEAVRDEIQIDIYLPHMSKIGIPIEDIISSSSSVEGFHIANINILFASKLFTLSQRANTSKGRKDFLDLLSLFLSKYCEKNSIKNYIQKYKLEKSTAYFINLLNELSSIDELSLNKHNFKKVKNELSKMLD